MDELKEKLESIEVLLQANIAKMNKIVAEANDPQKKAEEAQILIKASQEISSVSNELKKSNLSLKNAIEGFKPTVEVRQMQVDVKKPLFWILGAVFVMIICGLTTYHFIQENSNLEAKNAKLRKVDMKYRYLKVATFINVKKFENTKDLTAAMDDYYSRNPNEVDSTVYAKEKQIREAFEAQELARQQEAAANQALEEAKRAKQKADSLKKVN